MSVDEDIIQIERLLSNRKRKETTAMYKRQILPFRLTLRDGKIYFNFCGEKEELLRNATPFVKKRVESKMWEFMKKIIKKGVFHGEN